MSNTTAEQREKNRIRNKLYRHANPEKFANYAKQKKVRAAYNLAYYLAHHAPNRTRSIVHA